MITSHQQHVFRKLSGLTCKGRPHGEVMLVYAQKVAGLHLPGFGSIHDLLRQRTGKKQTERKDFHSASTVWALRINLMLCSFIKVDSVLVSISILQPSIHPSFTTSRCFGRGVGVGVCGVAGVYPS